MVHESKNTKIAGTTAQPKVDKVIFYVKEKNSFEVFLVRSPKYWSLVGGKDGLEQELDEEVDSVLTLSSLVHLLDKSKPVRVYALRLARKSQICASSDFEILESKWVTVNEHTNAISVLTANYWKDKVVFDYILQNEKACLHVCPICGCSCSVKTHYQCDVENGDYPEDDYYDDDHDETDFYDEPDQEEGPCDDCDDKKMPYAERSCESCPHGGKGCLGELKVDESEFDEDDDYILDMWGPNAVNRRHNK